MKQPPNNHLKTVFSTITWATVISWVFVIGWMALIFHLSAQPAVDSNELSTGITQRLMAVLQQAFPRLMEGLEVSRLNRFVRKSGHFFAYLILGLLVSNALGHSGQQYTGRNESTRHPLNRRNHLPLGKPLVALLICFLYAVSDEVHQLYVPGRGGQVSDVLLDTAGASIGILCYWFGRYWRRRAAFK
ncbi:VanZ family protein [Anoxynatronum buryatiense]|uniref:VanZ like family protein n=1 Tax=Anoxynatronum buryatiense TaxID=489973 RepID=A0AA45WX56_9CLOT|nr:VanZ family protein [Anoxynatronum buryatiense]SMP57299.1 VanZ like family protein [Anoxynatronum buryatiense]